VACPLVPWEGIAAAAEAAVATDRAPAAAMTMDLDRLSRISGVVTRGPFGGSHHAMYFTLDRNCHRAGDRHLRVGCGADQGAGLTRGCHPYGLDAVGYPPCPTEMLPVTGIGVS